MMKQEIYQYIVKNAFFKNHQKVLIAVSGGADSMALLHLLQCYQTKLGISIGIAHVNHKQRAASEDEEAYLRSWAQKNQIPIYVGYFSGLFTEQRARDFRYHFFASIMEKEQYTALVTAHHMDDQAETVLMRLIRGSRLRHLAGIRPVQAFASGELIRPFLTFRKKELPSYYHFEDESNSDHSYFRNRIRQSLLPELTKENPQLVKALSEVASEISLLNEAFHYLTADIPITNMASFLQQPAAIQYFLLQDYIAKIGHLNLAKSQFDTVLTLLQHHKCGTYSLKGGYALSIDEHTFTIAKIIPKTDKDLTPIVLNCDSAIDYLGYQFFYSLFEPCLAYDTMIPLYSLSSVTIRRRQAGDSINFGTFTKKLRRLFIDNKIPQKARERAIIGEQNGQVIFILVNGETYLRKAANHDIMLGKLYIAKIEKR
ncbi:tRNA lysidine(34) synthetase TilS [Streptococcus halichoeri]|uniref:tRNA lysidine(34) synthetase TilS n=1 Tax=Streptococcus halichoeri TaxID=254785 RepID=UPI001FCB1F5B|nr:tRNA lysidine(34) synthetase TilS [Streptococcus halichoeri]